MINLLKITVNENFCIYPFVDPQYQILTPAYYDQNGQLIMNPRGLNTPVRLVSPAPVLVSAATPASQQGKPCTECTEVEV